MPLPKLLKKLASSRNDKNKHLVSKEQSASSETRNKYMPSSASGTIATTENILTEQSASSSIDVIHSEQPFLSSGAQHNIPSALVTSEATASEAILIGTISQNISLPEKLWNTAYDSLKKDDEKLIKAYETLLTKEICDHDATEESVIVDDVVRRRVQMLKFVDNGLSRTEKEAAKKKMVANVARKVDSIKTAVAAGLAPSPEATMIWTALTAVLPFVLNASEQSAKNRDGMDTVLLILKKTDILCPRTFADTAAEEPREELTVKLYKSLLLFLIKSACYYYRNRLSVLLADSIKLDDWEEQVKSIRDTESTLESWLKAMIPLTTEDDACLSKLQLTNPSRDKKRIEATAGSLFRDCYRWVLDHEAYQQWRNEDSGILWIKGDPGKGKTMLLCGIIDELASLRSMSYFFCQAAYDKTNNNASAVLRGLIWMLADRNSSLIRHIRNKVAREAENVYNDHNSFLALGEILRSMLQDTDESVLIVDALDECDYLRNELIEFIKDTSRSYKVKWLISSRNWPNIEERLQDTPRLSLEIEKSTGTAVQIYITLKVAEFTAAKRFDQETIAIIAKSLSERADGTFLWVALVCANLNAVGTKRTAKNIVEELPPTLDGLYKRMLKHVTTSKESQTLSRVLTAVTHVYRPVSVTELGNIIDISDDNLNYIDDLVQECGSFLTIQDNIIKFVHKSAQDYIRTNLPSGLQDIHREIYHCSVRAMSRTLKRNIYKLEDTASNVKDLQPLNPDPLAPVSYCCLYWVQHLEQSARVVDEMSENSSLSTFFYKHYLYWLEAVSLLRDIPQAISSMHIAYTITKIYDSGLVFCPSRSLVKEIYTGMAPSWAKLTLNPEEDWPAYLTSFSIDLEYRGGKCATYSSDGKLIAVATHNGDILICDALNGSLCQRGKFPMAGNSRAINNVVFDDTDSSIIYLHTIDKLRTGLGSWDLRSLQFKEVKSFPRQSRLSPDAKHVAYIQGARICVCHIETDETSFLPSTAVSIAHEESSDDGQKIVMFTFAADGCGIAAQRFNGSIEVWDIHDKSMIRSFQGLETLENDKGDAIALSKDSDILAVRIILNSKRVNNTQDENNEDDKEHDRVIGTKDLDEMVQVFSVKRCTLLWQTKVENHLGSAPISFFKHEFVLGLTVPNSHVRLYDAYTGVCISTIPIGYPAPLIIATPRQLALIHPWVVDLLNYSQQGLPITHTSKRVALLGNHLHVYAEKEEPELTRWSECWDSDTGKLLWANSPFNPRDSMYFASSSKYSAMVRDNIVIVFYWNGISNEKHSSFPIINPFSLKFSPNGKRVSCLGDNLVIIYDIELRRTDEKIFLKALDSYSCETSWSDDSQGFLIYHQSECLFLRWSYDTGFEEFQMDAWPASGPSISPSGTILAYLTSSEKSSGFEWHKLYNLHIQNLSDTKISLTVAIQVANNYYLYDHIAPALVFSPCGTRILILGNEDLCIYSTSGALLLPSLQHNVFVEYVMRGEMKFDSDVTLRTNGGILRIEEGDVYQGTTREPFMGGKWIYLNNRKVLWLPPDYRLKKTLYFKGRYAIEHSNGNIALLRFEFNKMP